MGRVWLVGVFGAAPDVERAGDISHGDVGELDSLYGRALLEVGPRNRRERQHVDGAFGIVDDEIGKCAVRDVAIAFIADADAAGC